MGEGGGGEEKFLSFTSLPFSLPFFPFSPETPDTQAKHSLGTNRHVQMDLAGLSGVNDDIWATNDHFYF